MLKVVTFIWNYSFEIIVINSVLFSSISQGSVIAHLMIIGDSHKNLSQPLLEAVKHGKVGSLAVDKEYFKSKFTY